MTKVVTKSAPPIAEPTASEMFLLRTAASAENMSGAPFPIGRSVTPASRGFMPSPSLIVVSVRTNFCAVTATIRTRNAHHRKPRASSSAAAMTSPTAARSLPLWQ